MVSTRQLADYSELSLDQEENSASTGNSGPITFSVGNLDPLNQILNVNFQTPQINIDPAAFVLANTTTGAPDGGLVPSPEGYKAGEINFSATNESYNVGGLGLLGGDLSILAREADIYIGSSAVIRGNDVTLGSQGGDVNLVTAVGNALPSTGSTVGNDAVASSAEGRWQAR